MLGALPAAVMLATTASRAQVTPETALPTSLDAPGKMLLTVFLRHDEAKTVDQINEHLRQTGCTTGFRRTGWR